MVYKVYNCRYVELYGKGWDNNIMYIYNVNLMSLW